MSLKSGSLNLLEHSEPHRTCYGTPLPLPLCVSAKSCVHLRGHRLELLSNSQKTFRYNAVYFLPNRTGICPLNTVIDVRNLLLAQLWMILKSETVTYVKWAQKFSFRQWKYNKTKVAEEYCWAITQTVGRSCCGRSGSGVLDFEFQLDSVVYTHTHTHTHTSIYVCVCVDDWLYLTDRCQFC